MAFYRKMSACGGSALGGKNDHVKFKIFSCIAVLFFVFFGAAKAESPKLIVAPDTFEMRVERGQIAKDKIRILNQSDFPIPLLAKTSDFTAQEETGRMLINESENDSSFAARKWIKIAKPNFILDPGETETVNFSVEVPKNAEPGGHYATVLFEPQLPSSYFKEGAPKVIPVIGVIFLFSVEAEGKTASFEPVIVAEFGIPDSYRLKKLENSITSVAGFFTKAQAQEKSGFSIVENAFLPFKLSIKNNNIYHTKPYGELEIVGSGGKILGRTEINKTTILPGKIREIPVNFQPESFLSLKKHLPAAFYDFLNRNFIWGKYRARLTLTAEKPRGVIFSAAGSPDDKIVQTVEFWVFPWKIALAVFILITAILLMKKRIIMAGMILFNLKLKNQNEKSL